LSTELILSKLDELCKRLTALEKDFANHVESQKLRITSRREKTYLGIAIVTTGIMIASLVFDLL